MTLSVPEKLTVEKALEILTETSAGVKKWGRQAKPPFTVQQIVDAAMKVYESGEARLNALADAANEDYDELRAQLTKANRQLAACEARNAKASKNKKID